MAIIERAFFFLCVAALLNGILGHGQGSQSFRIPSNSESCNVVNLNFGGGEEEQAMGPQGPPGKRGSPGLKGMKGNQGKKGDVGPIGQEPVINMAEMTTAVMKALGASSCDELTRLHGISESGHYLIRSKETKRSSVYTYCDFEIRQDVRSCQQLKVLLAAEMKVGYYRVGTNEFIYCGYPEDCKVVDPTNAIVGQAAGGIFDISYPGSFEKSLEVYCDLETDGGGWIVFQRRMDGSVDFFRDWHDYVDGFGNMDGEFWLGLENLYRLTRNGSFELRVDLTDMSGGTAYANYGTFSVGPGVDQYQLTVENQSGTAGNALSIHNGMRWSSRDADHDTHSSLHCALKNNKGAWWYANCQHANLNGLYNKQPGSGITGIVWYEWKNTWEYLRKTEMKFRKKE